MASKKAVAGAKKGSDVSASEGSDTPAATVEEGGELPPLQPGQARVNLTEDIRINDTMYSKGENRIVPADAHPVWGSHIEGDIEWGPEAEKDE